MTFRPSGTAIRALLISCGAPFTIAGCTATDRSAQVIEADSAGIRIVESIEPAWAESERWRLSEAPTLQIGAETGSEGEELFAVEDVDRLSDGRLVVTNQGTHELRVYSTEGEFLDVVGREGQGPGEFMYPSRTWVGVGDSLFVRAFQRLAVFDGAGTFVRAVTLAGWSPEDRFHDGTFLFVVIPPGVDRFEPGHFHPINALVKSAADGSAADTLVRVPGSELYRFESSAGGMASFRAPFGSNRVAATYGDSVVTAGGTAFEVWLLDERGALKRIMRRRTEPTRVTEADIAALEERLLEAAPPHTHADRRRLFAEWTYPEFKAALDKLLVDSEGNVWVRAFSVDPTTAGEWSVFDPTGRWLGEVETPPGLEIEEIGDDYLVGVWVDDLDVEYVRLYSLEKP